MVTLSLQGNVLMALLYFAIEVESRKVELLNWWSVLVTLYCSRSTDHLHSLSRVYSRCGSLVTESIPFASAFLLQSETRRKSCVVSESATKLAEWRAGSRIHLTEKCWHG
jgi:hypothetical protein